jgi:hypothetical protein
VSWSPTLFSGSSPVGLPPIPWTKKKQLQIGHFSSEGVVIPAEDIWLYGQNSEFFLSGLQKLEQRAKKCIVFRGECVE